MIIGVTGWLLSCGHTIPLLDHDKPGEPPRRPRMCPVCQRPRNVNVTPKPDGDTETDV